MWYARIEIAGKDTRRSLRTKSLDEATRRLDFMRPKLIAERVPHVRRRHFVAELLRLSRSFTGKGVVYFVQAIGGGPIKIGTSRAPGWRLQRLQGANGRQLQILAQIRGATEIERVLHQRFAAQRLNGEWFKPTQRLRRLIDALKDGTTRGTEATVHASNAHDGRGLSD